ncbi:MAG: histidinol-phosphate transaminase [Cyanobacteriota bacterium]|nr:histidinol-phosphate transaminase [Cyanobacteriota bacterium]
MTTYFRANVQAMSGYVPGEQPPPHVRTIKLNTNENPYPPSPKAMQILQGFDPQQLRRYPNPTAKEFCQGASQVLGVPADWILAGNGSDDLLTMLFRACSEPGRAVAYPVPTYVLYRTLAEIQGAETIEIPYSEDYSLPTEELIEAQAAITFIASPNSPSGTLVPLEILDKLAANLSGVLVVDEAYVDFAETNALELVKKHENTIVLRTLSKGYSLAGLRFGFGVANPVLLAGLMKVKDSYNVDAIAIAMATAAIADSQHKEHNAEKVKLERTAVTSALLKLGFYVLPSQANFVLATVPVNVEAEFLYRQLKERGILVRYFKQPKLDNKLRITIGTPEENTALIETLSSLL